MDEEDASIPDDLPEADVISIHPPHGPARSGVTASAMCCLSRRKDTSTCSPTRRPQQARAGDRRAQRRPEGETFICVGPGRWGTSTPNLGVYVAYGDIYRTRALVELTRAARSARTSSRPSAPISSRT